MLLIESFLNSEEMAQLKGILAEAPYVSGENTVGAAGQTVKNNLQVKEGHQNYIQANQIVRNAIVQCEALQNYVFPHVVTPIRFAKYGPGMYYGDHFDAALMPLSNAVLRTDLSFTLFLSSPSDYVGGELVVNLTGAEKTVKGESGDLFLYPSGNQHRVEEILTGNREVAVGWIQSMYAMPEQRQILANISTVRHRIFNEKGKNEDFDRLNQAYITLERMWAKP